MAATSDNPVPLTSVPTESEAIMIVGALEAEGMQATTIGGLTSGYRAEAPGMVHVLVHPANLARAREILAEIEAAKSDETDADEL